METPVLIIAAVLFVLGMTRKEISQPHSGLITQ